MTATPPSPQLTGGAPSGRLRSPRFRTWALYLPFCVATSVMAISTWDVRVHGAGVAQHVTDQAVLLWLIGSALAVSLAWRRQFPELITAGSALVALVLPIDPTVALIAVASLIVRRLDKVTGGLIALVFAATAVSVWRDGQGQTRASSFWLFLVSSDQDQHAVHNRLSLWVLLAIACAVTTVFVASGLVIRDRVQSRSRAEREEAQQLVVESMSGELLRHGERERLAQEVHDVLGHRLSLLSLHAGALEVAAGDNVRAAESAALVRENAQRSMDDLRSLLAMLRHPDAPDVAAAVPDLRDLAALIDETVSTGVNLVSTVQLDLVERLDQATSRSGYRIVQELLTNARRHAPGIGIRVRVSSTPTSGVEVEVANFLPVTASQQIVKGSGLTGIQTRVEQLGGQWRCWVDESRVFRAAAWLPWVWEAAISDQWPVSVGEDDV